MRLALADQSSMPLWTGEQWLFILAALAFLASAWFARELRRAPHQDADVSNLDAADGVTEGQPACWNTGPRGGHYVRAIDSVWYCAACGSTWPRNGIEPYDQEVGA